jgi:hypothetical protein
VRVEDADGRTLAAPTLATFHGRRAGLQVVDQVAFVRDFDVERSEDAFVVDPVIGVLEEGLAVEVTARPTADGARTILAFEVRTASLHRPLEVFPVRDLSGRTLSIQLPALDRAEAEGVRPVDHGVWSLLARLPGEDGRPVSVLARVEPIRGEGASAAALPDESGLPILGGGDPPAIGGADGARGPREDTLPARAARAPLPEPHAGILEVRGVVLRTGHLPGSVVEAAAAAGALADAVALDPADLRLATGLVPGARASCLLQESFLRDYEVLAERGLATADPEVGEQVSGLTASVEEGGALRLSWTATPAWDTVLFSPTDDDRRLAVEVPTSATREAVVVPGEEARLVILSRLKDGRSAAALVRFLSAGP